MQKLGEFFSLCQEANFKHKVNVWNPGFRPCLLDISFRASAKWTFSWVVSGRARKTPCSNDPMKSWKRRYIACAKGPVMYTELSPSWIIVRRTLSLSWHRRLIYMQFISYFDISLINLKFFWKCFLKSDPKGSWWLIKLIKYIIYNMSNIMYCKATDF